MRTSPTSFALSFLALVAVGGACSVADDPVAASPSPSGDDPVDAATNDDERGDGDGGAAADSGLDGDASTGTECGGAAASKCGDGKPCLTAADCQSGVCTNNTCIAPSPTDGVKNGTETDIDCGGTGPGADGGTIAKCAAMKHCVVGSDCASATCRAGVCAQAPSCAQVNGGATCGPGEVGAAGAVHEDCCTAAVVPRPVANGGPFVMDKYLITAGRMRVFLEATGYDVRGWIANHRPAWWTGTGTTTWDAMLPTNKDEFLSFMTTGGTGCYIGAAAGDSGAPAFWAPADDLARVVGGAPRTYTQAELDTKVMNCFRAPLFHALCAYDGGRLPSRDEWIAARTVAGVVQAYPWGDNGTDADRRARAVYDFNYAWPNRPAANANDSGGILAAPGRFPLGNGPFGHADLLGSVENMGSRPAPAGGPGVVGDGWFQFSFQESEVAIHPYGDQTVSFGSGAYKPHWAVGARCVKLP